jgi:polyisoprenoid-binding protein YceI
MRGCHERVPGRLHRLGWLQARRWLSVAAALALTMDAGAALSAEGWRIDEAHTAIGFKVAAAGRRPVQGRFTRFAGDIFLDLDHPEKCFTRFTVEAGSVEAGAQPYSDIIKSAALLNAAQFRTLSFASTAFEKIDAHTARLAGDLTMVGVTRPIALTVEIETESPAKGRAVTFQATGTIKRSEFGMMWGIPSVSDALEITVQTRALADD